MIIPYLKGLPLQFSHIGNRYVRTVSTSLHSLYSLLNTKSESNSQATGSVASEYQQNLRQELIKVIRLTQHAYEKRHNMKRADKETELFK